MDTRVAYVANGTLFAGPLRGALDEAPTKFVDQYMERARRSQARNAWKYENRDQSFLAGAMLWGGAGGNEVARPVVVSAARGRTPGELLYVVQSERVSSVFANPWSGACLERDDEVRIASHNNLSILDVAVNGEESLIACAVEDGTGATHLGIMEADGRRLDTVTAGDSEDLAPCWHPRLSRTLVYQSAGIARGADETFMGFGPVSIAQLRLDSGSIDTLVEDPKHDCFAPTFGSDGSLYYLSRPYHAIGQGASLASNLADALLAPFRLVMAGAAFLSFFAMRYGKSLSQNSDEELMRLRHVAARRRAVINPTTRAFIPGMNAKKDEDPWRVPSTWRLMRLGKGDEPQVVAERVLDYDHAPDGHIVFTDGKALILLAPDGSTEALHEQPGIQRVTVLG